jgi:hypothetical protein
VSVFFHPLHFSSDNKDNPKPYSIIKVGEIQLK